jgi:amidohydrolase
MVDISALCARAVALRHDLHRHPELMYEEKRTAQVVRDDLTKLKIPWVTCADTGTIARLAPNAVGKHIALRADLDALPLSETTGLSYASCHPGKMHACGHDGHTASLLATAMYLKQKENQLPGPVTLLFQPAEEGGHGAKRMIEGGALIGIDEIFSYHNWPPIPFGQAACAAGAIFAANGEWTATIHGRGGHASQPQHCIDPILTGAHFVTMAQQIVARQISPQQAGVVSVTCFHGGTADNIIPDSVELTGTVRAATTTLRDELAQRCESILHAACQASGAHGQFDYRPCYPATINHSDSAQRAQHALRNVLGPQALSGDALPIMAAEDFGYYLQVIPGAYILLGAGKPNHTMEPCHSPRFDYNDDLIPIVVKLWDEIIASSAP